jgi:aminoglycoside/choline kinase family phosphotransferase
MVTDFEHLPPGSDDRLGLARAWLAGLSGQIAPEWRPIVGDASYRRYFRVTVDGQSRVLMDAPPDLEHSGAFVDVGRRLRAAGLHAPEILHSNLDEGFLLLEDLGDDLYRDMISRETVQPLFDDAFRALAVMARAVSPAGLPVYDRELFGRELGWFTGYYLGRHRGHGLDKARQSGWQAFCNELISTANEQPQVFVHKDIHSSNLMRTSRNNPGIIDFQDAVRGPLTYDFVSLIWDRYVAWPRDLLERWMEQFRRMVAPNTDPADWVRWCDLMGLQRNLKIVGRFALLRYEQDRQGYVEMIPRFYGYVLDVLALYPEFSAIREWLESDACAP